MKTRSPAQQSAIVEPGHTLILATAGSGKTTVLTERTKHLLQAGSSATVLTFTRQASEELSRRCGYDATAARKARDATAGSLDLVTGTFHAYVMRMAISAGIRVIMPNQSSLLLRTAWQPYSSECSFDEIEAALDRNPNGSEHPAHIKAILDEYAQLLVKSKAVDFASLLRHVAAGIRDRSVKPVPTKHLLIDEFQDVDPPQLDWFLANIEAGVVGTAVGDDDQSIYGFRNSLGYNAFEEFQNKFSPSVIHLSTNYRSNREILDRSGALIQKNTARISKNIVSARGPGGRFDLVRFPRQQDEVQSLIDHVAGAPHQWAIILRRNSEIDLVEQSLVSYSIPYRRIGGKSFWSLQAPSMLVNLIGTIRGSDIVLLAPIFGCYHVPTDVAERFVKSRGALNDGSGIPVDIDPRHARAGKLILEGIHRARTLHSAKSYDQALSMLRQLLKPIKELNQDHLDSAERAIARMSGTLPTRVAALGRSSPKEAEGLWLGTMHGSKGAEFENVWLPCLNHEVIPSKQSNDREEERRLLYVGMTRAKNRLMMSFHDQRSTPAGKTTEAFPSEFLSELNCELPAKKTGR